MRLGAWITPRLGKQCHAFDADELRLVFEQIDADKSGVILGGSHGHG